MKPVPGSAPREAAGHHADVGGAGTAGRAPTCAPRTRPARSAYFPGHADFVTVLAVSVVTWRGRRRSRASPGGAWRCAHRARRRAWWRSRPGAAVGEDTLQRLGGAVLERFRERGPLRAGIPGQRDPAASGRDPPAPALSGGRSTARRGGATLLRPRMHGGLSRPHEHPASTTTSTTENAPGAIRLREERRDRWQQEGERSLWQNLSMIGSLGWLDRDSHPARHSARTLARRPVRHRHHLHRRDDLPRHLRRLLSGMADRCAGNDARPLAPRRGVSPRARCP